MNKKDRIEINIEIVKSLLENDEFLCGGIPEEIENYYKNEYGYTREDFNFIESMLYVTLRSTHDDNGENYKYGIKELFNL